MEDSKTIKRCQMGNKEAFQELISEYHPIVYKFLVKLTENEEVAKDLTQDTFIRVIRNIEKFDVNGSAKFSTYIIAISKNLYIDYLRREKGILLNVPIDRYLNLEDADLDIENVVTDRLYSHDILENMEKLTEEQKIAIKMKYIEGLTLKEIGEILKVEPKTIKSRIHNGMAKLRKILEGRE
jgi:RNA polymerase sigma-70 factor (ECF subfamily)